MIQTMDLNKMGLTTLTPIEMSEIDGGNLFWDIVRAWGLEKALDYLYKHRMDILSSVGTLYQNGMVHGASAIQYH